MNNFFFYLKYPLLIAGLASMIYFAPTNFSSGVSKEQVKKERIVSQVVHNTLLTSHFSPPEMNEAFSVEVFDEFISALDYSKRILLQSDIDALRKHEKRVLTYLEESDLTLFDESYDIAIKRLSELPDLVDELLAHPLDFSSDLTYETDDEKRTWPKNEAEQRALWKNYLTYKVMSRVYDAERRQNKRLENENEEENDGDDAEDIDEDGDSTDNDKSKAEEIKSFAQLEEEAREKELVFQKEWLENYRELERIDWFGMYINSFANNFDPHTEYYPPQQRDDFEVEMSGQFEGIGAQLLTKGDHTTIDKVVTGSASWRQGDLEVGDKILLVAEEGEEPVDVVGMSIRKVVKLIRGKKGTTVVLTVQKMDGSRSEIPIVRDVVEIEATFARGAVIEENGRKMGYIRLPKFYVDFNKKDARNCADDVKAEIKMLRADGVEGIILDLRSNGGGTLEGVVDIAGFFIQSGPIVQVQSSGFSPRILKDRDNNIEFDGPLVVMTNRFSASASEIFAAAIQDYERGIIMGSPSTFGKGTVQNMADLDRVVGFRHGDVKPLGALKLTIQKFYRINGGTPQLRGVESDIVLPDQFNYIEIGESDRKKAMAYSEIKPASYNKWERDASAYDRIVAESKQRIAANPEFQNVDSYARWLSDQRDQTEVNLNYASYSAKQNAFRETSEQYRDIFKTDHPLSVRIPGTRKEMLEEEDLSDWEKWVSDVGKDLQITEAFEVLKAHN